MIHNNNRICRASTVLEHQLSRITEERGAKCLAAPNVESVNCYTQKMQKLFGVRLKLCLTMR